MTLPIPVFLPVPQPLVVQQIGLSGTGGGSPGNVSNVVNIVIE